MDANDQLRVRGKAAQSLAEEVSDFKSDVQVMKDALIWLGSSALTGDTVGQVLTNVRKKVVEALVSASAIDTLEISDESHEKQEASSEQQHNNRDDNNRDDNHRDDNHNHNHNNNRDNGGNSPDGGS
jgi:ABC-type Zn2+ transport system substrate-binding protein/surface adhesin